MSQHISEPQQPLSSICTLLVAEDNLGDFVLLKRTLTKMNVRCTVVRAQNGREAIDYLEQCGKPPINMCPTHFILDLKMPLVSGFDVLEWLRSREDYKHLPVIVLSSSSIDIDVQKAETFGVDAYLVKPAGLDELALLVEKILKIWQLPHSIA
ncbi:MAG TPA: response regulator [Candidatus Saccharimonadales bacterium]|nr:response regulator [Candidatus Saccharimonadales bacterium]